MKLARKIALVMTIGVCAVLTVDGFIRVDRQLTLFETDIERDHLSIGRATAAAMTEAWLSYGEALALDLINRVGKREGKVHIAWIRFPTKGQGAGAMEIPAEALKTTLQGREFSHRSSDEDGHASIYTYVPVTVDKRVAGVISLTESLDQQVQYVRTTIIRTIATTVVMILIIVGIVFALGFLFIGRPVAKLVDKVKRVGKRDFSGRLDFRQNDELAELAGEMDAMVDRLDEAKNRIELETAARLATLEQLRHADRLKTVGQLTTSIIHELGTPLTVVSGRAKMIASGEAKGDEIVNCARIAFEQTDRITKTIRHILDFARLGKKEQQPGDIAKMAHEMTCMITPVAVKSGVFLDWEGGEKPAMAHVDMSQIQQVLANLIMNAIQAAGAQKHVTVGIRLEEHKSADGLKGKPGKMWAIYVRDEGDGIDPDVLPHIFEPFYTTKKSGQGTGLGLSISNGIAREHEGSITVESEDGKGSCFTVYLPVYEQDK